MKLSTHRYGKARVRVLKVNRLDARHEVKEVEVSVMLEGDFDAAYLRGDNSRVVPTDTIKNIVSLLAKEHLGAEIETFGAMLGRHFLKRYAQVRTATVELLERRWQRMEVDGRPHPHSFVQDGQGRPFARVHCAREELSVESGVRDLVSLKSTGSGFTGFAKDEFTTLRETEDRLLATNLTASWKYARPPAEYARTNRAVLDAMLRVFAANYSPSVQATLFQMGEAALRAAPEIAQVTLSMPNKHCLPVDLSPFGMENRNEVFVPTDEPHGQIEATVARE
jgi:urate oxidase